MNHQIETRVELDTDIALALTFLDKNYVSRVGEPEKLHIGIFRKEWTSLPLESLRAGDFHPTQMQWSGARGRISFLTSEGRYGGGGFDVVIALNGAVVQDDVLPLLVGPKVMIVRG